MTSSTRSAKRRFGINRFGLAAVPAMFAVPQKLKQARCFDMLVG